MDTIHVHICRPPLAHTLWSRPMPQGGISFTTAPTFPAVLSWNLHIQTTVLSISFTSVYLKSHGSNLWPFFPNSNILYITLCCVTVHNTVLPCEILTIPGNWSIWRKELVQYYVPLYDHYDHYGIVFWCLSKYMATTKKYIYSWNIITSARKNWLSIHWLFHMIQ